MSAALRRRLATLEDAALRHQVEQCAQRFGVDADELLDGARLAIAQYNRLRRGGLSSQVAWRQVRERVASEHGVTVAHLDAEYERCTNDPAARLRGGVSMRGAEA